MTPASPVSRAHNMLLATLTLWWGSVLVYAVALVVMRLFPVREAEVPVFLLLVLGLVLMGISSIMTLVSLAFNWSYNRVAVALLVGVVAVLAFMVIDPLGVNFQTSHLIRLTGLATCLVLLTGATILARRGRQKR